MVRTKRVAVRDQPGPSSAPYKPDEFSAKINSINEGIAQNPADISLSKAAPMVLKTPSGAIKVFRNGAQVKP